MAGKEDAERAARCPVSVFHPLRAEGRPCPPERQRAVLGVLSRCAPG